MSIAFRLYLQSAFNRAMCVAVSLQSAKVRCIFGQDLIPGRSRVVSVLADEGCARMSVWLNHINSGPVANYSVATTLKWYGEGG